MTPEPVSAPNFAPLATVMFVLLNEEPAANVNVPAVTVVVPV